MLTIPRDLNVYSSGMPPIISLSQYDSDFQLVFNLYTSEGTLNIPSGTTAQIQGTKRDGNGYSASATISGNTVTVTGHNQMTACAGANIYEISLTNSGKVLNTINFILAVEPAAMDAGTIQSETVLKELQAIIDSAATSTQAAQDAEDAADRAEEAARSLTVDPTLTQSGQPADAKVTGDEIADLKADLEELEPGLSDEAKTALLNCFAHVAWVDEHGQDYYDTLESALYPSDYPKIIAVFNSGQNTIYTDDTLDSLRQYLTVKYFASSESAGTIIPDNDYTLSGVLREGESIVRVAYNDMATTFTLVAVNFYDIWEWSLSNGLISKQNGGVDPQQSYSPSTLSISATSAANYSRRRTAVVSRGKAQIYRPSTTDVSTAEWLETGFYPIPVPLTANHIKITMSPLQDIYMHFVPYIETSEKYGNSVADNKITWTTIPSGGLEKNIVQSAEGQMFIVANFRYNSSASDYPVEPTEIKIEFSEV